MNRFLTKLLWVPLLRDRITSWLLQVRTEGGGLVPLEYIEPESGRLIVLASGEEKQTWWRGLSADSTTEITLRLRREDRTGQARLLTGDALDKAMLAYLHRFPRAWMALGVETNATEEQVGEAARSATVVEITTQPR